RCYPAKEAATSPKLACQRRYYRQLPNAFFDSPDSGSTPGYGNSNASRCTANNCSQAAIAASSILSSVERGNVAPSPVPWISTSVPVSVATTFISTSARESSVYGRSTRTRPSTTPTLTAAIAHDSGRGSDSLPPAPRYVTASASATYAPVIAAVRVPPSACSTSQSIAMVFSPSAPRSMHARSDRPTSRLISCVRPPTRPLTDSRSDRSWVAAGSIAYSAVSQPNPEPLRQRGTPSVTLAVHITRVSPNSTNTDPAG